MDFMKSLNISASGMSVQRTRVGLASSNLANVETTRTEDGTGPYRRLDAIVTPASFDDALGEAGGDGVETGRHAATLTGGSIGILHGAKSYVLQDEEGQTIESHSISAGLDYPGVGPEHAYLKDVGRVIYQPITDAEAMNAMADLAKTEGILVAIETAHAIAGAIKLGKELGSTSSILINCSGRGDKDVVTAAKWFGLPIGDVIA